MHSFRLSTTVLAVLAISICRAASIMESIFPALPLDSDLIGTPDLTKFFGDVGEGGFGGVGISPAVIPVAGEKAVNARTQRLHAEERADGVEIWYAHKLGRRSLVADALGAAKPLTQAVGSKLLPAVEAAVQAVSPPAADAVTEVVNTVEGALDLVA